MADATRAAAGRLGEQDTFAIPIAGGVATYAEPGSPFNKLAGLGFGGPPAAADLEKVERAFAAQSCSVQIELAHLGDPSLGELLTSRGYRLVSFENVLGAALDDRRTGDPEPVPSPGLIVRRSGADEFERWLDVMFEGFASADGQGVPSHEVFAREAMANAQRDFATVGVVRYAAELDGALAGGGCMRVTSGIAQLTGAATVPAYRRRGVQTALLAARLADAAAAGCGIAVVTTQPGSKSQQNVQRRGFDLLFTRAILVKAG